MRDGDATAAIRHEMETLQKWTSFNSCHTLNAHMKVKVIRDFLVQGNNVFCGNLGNADLKQKVFRNSEFNGEVYCGRKLRISLPPLRWF